MNAPEPLLSRAGVTGLPSPHRVGAFEFQSVIARGDTGFVYRAWDHALARPVAIKEYLPSGIARRESDGRVVPLGPGMVALFERGREAFVDEARALARCDHPSLVRVLHLAEADGTAYRVMPLYAGRPLQEVRRAMAGPPDEAALRALLDDLLGGLEVLHQAAGPHGSISAGQVMLLEDDRAVLLGTSAAMRAILPSAGTAPSLGGDLHALATIARWCIVGDAVAAAGMGVAEPLAATVDRLFFEQPAVHYSPTLLRALDIVLSPDLARRPNHPAQLREWLAGADMPAYTAPAPVDPVTAGAIRRTIDAIPEPVPAAPDPVGTPTLPDLALPILDDLRGVPPLRARPSRSGRVAVWGVLFAIALGAAGFAAWRLPLAPFQRAEAPAQPRPAAVVAPVPVVEPVADTVPEKVPEKAPEVMPAPPVAEAPSAPPTNIADTELADPAAAVVAPVRVEPKPPAPARPERPARPGAASPREQCGARTDFSLYRCMQQQCATAAWSGHAQCERLRATDRVE